MKRPGKPKLLIIGHPDLASGHEIRDADTLYVSVAEAIYRESRGENVEIHWRPTDEDEAAVAESRERTRRKWQNDPGPDGWTRPVPEATRLLKPHGKTHP